jgi:hypothetical protein
VNYKIDIVEKDPFSFFVPFNMQWSNSDLAELLIDTFGDGLIVTAGRSGANDEVVGERTYLVEFEDRDVLRFLVESGFKRFSQMVVGWFFGNCFYLFLASGPPSGSPGYAAFGGLLHSLGSPHAVE